MKKFYVFVSVLFLLLASTIGCSNKEINLITNIDFELSLSNEDSGFVQDSLPTTIILTPERTNYPGFSYYINYKVMEGEGYYLTEDDTEVPAETDILVSKEEDFTANWKYIGTTAGEHKITVNGRDNFEKTKVATMQYEIKPINLIWEALSPQTMAKINDTIPLTLRLENTSGAPLTFENTIKIEEGAGLVLDVDKKAITLNRALSIDEGVLSLFYVGAAAGQNIIRFDLDVSNASKKTTQVSFDIKEELKNEPPVAVIDTISTTVAKPIVIDVLMNDTDPEDDVLTITTVTEPANGTATIENGMVVYTPNNAFVGNEPFSYTIMDVAGNEATGEIRVVVKMRETLQIPDRNFEEALIALGHDDVVDQKMFRDVAEGIESLDVSQVDDSVAEENKIQSLEGIEAFISLTNLEARFNALKTVDISKNLLLDKVDFESNRLTELDVSKNTKLTWLSVFRNQLPSLNISQNTNLVYLDADDNNLTTIELSKNEKLETLGLNENKLTVIDLTANTRLKSLSLGFRKPTTNVNVLTSVDVSRLLDLELLSVNYMQDLTSVDLSANKKLMTVFIKASGISSLDLSNNPAITRIDAANCSALETVNIRNGSNALITEFTVAGSVNLSCIQVDNRKEANANTNWKKDAAAFYSEDCSKPRETVAIPDDNFESALIALGYDEGALDDVMFKDVAESVISLNLTDKGIKQLSGIESFTSLESLRANKNQLTTIDLTQNKALKELFLDNNQLTTIDVSKNTGLEVFWIKDNQLTSIDLKENVVLETLSLTGNSIPSVNLTANRQLSNLGLARMPLASIDLSANTELVEVWISNAKLTTIDVSNLGSLKRLRLYGNQLTELNLQRVSANLTILDVTNNSALECIQVDNRKEANANTNWKKDATAFYSEDCSKPRETVAIPDDNFESALIALGYDEGALDDVMLKDVAESVATLDVSEKGIVDLTGIEAFTNLTELIGEKNNLTTVDISKNTKLKRVTFKENKLTTLDLSKNLELEWLELWFNEISSIDVSKNTALKFLDVDTNNLTAIDVRANVNLTELYLFNNKLTGIDLSRNTKLMKFEIGNRADLPNDNALTTLNVKGLVELSTLIMYNMPSLSCIEVDDVVLAQGQAGWQKDANAFYSKDCNTSKEMIAIPDSNFENVLFENYGDNALDGFVYKGIAESISMLDISNKEIADLTGIEAFVNLTELIGANNNLTSVDISNNTKLRRVTFKENKLTALDLSKNLELEWLELWFNEISAIDVSRNVALKFLDVDTNNLITIDVTKNINLTELYLFNNKLTEIDLSKNIELEKLQIGNRTGLPNNNALSTLRLKGLTKLIQNGMNHMSSLFCIEVDDVVLAEGQGNWVKDTTANYSTECN